MVYNLIMIESDPITQIPPLGIKRKRNDNMTVPTMYIN